MVFFLCRIRKGEQKEKINDVESPPILMAYSTSLHATDSKGQKASGGLPDERILNNWRADMMQQGSIYFDVFLKILFSISFR